uniref:Uncharacterized protein n=1 Tax=Ixodes ricinus TaxID=34613 RepID=A0A6B0U9E5_IXORI
MLFITSTVSGFMSHSIYSIQLTCVLAFSSHVTSSFTCAIMCINLIQNLTLLQVPLHSNKLIYPPGPAVLCSPVAIVSNCHHTDPS